MFNFIFLFLPKLILTKMVLRNFELFIVEQLIPDWGSVERSWANPKLMGD